MKDRALRSAIADPGNLILKYYYSRILNVSEGHDSLARLPFFGKRIGLLEKARAIPLFLFFPDAMNKGMLPIIETAPIPPMITPVPASSKVASLPPPIAAPSRINALPPPTM